MMRKQTARVERATVYRLAIGAAAASAVLIIGLEIYRRRRSRFRRDIEREPAIVPAPAQPRVVVAPPSVLRPPEPVAPPQPLAEPVPLPRVEPAPLLPLPAAPPARPPWTIIAVSAVLVAIAVVAFWPHARSARTVATATPSSTPTSALPTPSPIPEWKAPGKSIAVLPFENLSEDLENAFVADAIQDELLGGLAKIKELTVINRASLIEYRPYGTRNLREIATALGAANILEGAVRRDHDRVRVTLTLTDVQNDRHLWSNVYDRALPDALTLRSDIAAVVAATLGANISEAEKSSLNSTPTANADAYLLYLRAHDAQTRLTVELSDLNAAVSLFQQAIALDPKFALAYAGLSRAHSSIHQIAERTAARAAQARAAAEHALQLQPDLAEGHAARGLCYYWGDRDYESAARDLALAAEALPNDSALLKTLALLRRRQGAWRQAVANLDRASVLDPRNPLTLGSLGDLFVELRDWDAAHNARQKLVALASESWPELAPKAKIDAATVEFWRNGNLDSLRAVLAEISSAEDPEGEITFARFDTSMLSRDFDAAEKVLNDSALNAFRLPSGSRVPKSFLLGCVALARADVVRAKPLFDAQRASLEADAEAHPDDANRHAFLGMLYAFLARKQDAIREGRRAVDLAPEFFDTVNAPQIAAIQALIYARAGQADDAVPLIERLLTKPAAVSQHITLAELRARWEWDPIRNDPRFQQIIASPEPKTTYD